MERKKRLKIWLIILATVFLLGILFFIFIQIYVNRSAKNYIRTIDHLVGADAVLILGSRVYSDGTPSLLLQGRLDKGLEVYEKGLAPKIIVSGDHGTKEYNEVRAMKQYLLDKGVPEEDIFMDHAGFETYDSMYRAKKIFGAKKVVIVSQKYHLYRSLYIAKKMGLDAYGVSSDLRYYSKKQYYREAREWLARVKSFIKCIAKPEPKYLGDSIDLKASGDVTND